MPDSPAGDALDYAVLAVLVRDARASYADIGAEVGLSASAVKRRVDRLLARGVIRGFTVVLDPVEAGWTTEAYVELFCSGKVAPAELRRSLAQVPEVVGACTVSGAADALVHMLASDISHLEQALERVRADPRVDHTETVIVLSRLLDRAPVPEGGAPPAAAHPAG